MTSLMMNRISIYSTAVNNLNSSLKLVSFTKGTNTRGVNNIELNAKKIQFTANDLNK